MNYNIPVSNGLLTPEHRRKMGASLWVFLWLLDRTTKERLAEGEIGGEMEGLVLGGSPVTSTRIGDEIGESARTVRQHLNRLEQHGYIRRVDHGVGEAWGYVVTKSKKWAYHSAEKTATTPIEKQQETTQKPLDPPGKNTSQSLTEKQHTPDIKTSDPLPKKCPVIRNTLQDITDVTVTKTFAQKARKAVDPRRKDFIEDLKQYRETLTPGKFMFTARDAGNLAAWLREHPNITRETFQQCLDHRARSDINPAEEIYRWIGRVLEYSAGPLDRYGKPKAGGEYGNNANIANTKDQVIAAVSRAVLEQRRARRAAAGAAGLHAEPLALQAAIGHGD